MGGKWRSRRGCSPHLLYLAFPLNLEQPISSKSTILAIVSIETRVPCAVASTNIVSLVELMSLKMVLICMDSTPEPVSGRWAWRSSDVLEVDDVVVVASGDLCRLYKGVDQPSRILVIQAAQVGDSGKHVVRYQDIHCLVFGGTLMFDRGLTIIVRPFRPRAFLP